MRSHPNSRQAGHIVAIAGGRGASLISVTCDGQGDYRAEVLGTARAAGQSPRAVAEALTAAVSGPISASSLGGATLVLTELTTRARLVAIPPVKGAAQRTLLAQDLDPDDVFVSTPAGDAVESGRTLAGHLVLSARRADVRTYVDTVETRGLIVDGSVSFDRAFLTFAALRAGDTSGAMKIVVLLQPCWIDLACVADGGPLFVRRVETAADAPIAERLGSALTEAQKTALVVRGRLKNTAPLAGCVLIDPLRLASDEDVRLAADAAGIETGASRFRVTTTDGAEAAVLCDAVRAAVIEAVRAESSLAPAMFDVPTRGMRAALRRRVFAGAAAVVVFWAAGLAARESMRKETRTLRTGGGSPLTAPVLEPRPDDVARAEAREAAARFGEAHAGLLRFGADAPSAADLLRVIAAATPPGAACAEIRLSLEQEEDGTFFHDVLLKGFVRDEFQGARPVVRALTSQLRASAGVSWVEETEAETPDPRPDPLVPPARRMTPFAVALTAEGAP